MIAISVDDSKSVCGAPTLACPLRRGGGVRCQLPSPSCAALRAANNQPPRAGERFYIQVEFALSNCYKSKYRVVGRSSRSTRSLANGSVFFLSAPRQRVPTINWIARAPARQGKCELRQCLHNNIWATELWIKMGCSARYCLLTLILCLVTEITYGVRVMPKRKKGKFHYNFKRIAHEL